APRKIELMHLQVSDKVLETLQLPSNLSFNPDLRSARGLALSVLDGMSPKGSLALSGNGERDARWDGQHIRVWELRDERLSGPEVTPSGKVTRLIFSVDGSHLAVVTGESEIDVWNVSSPGVSLLWRG